MKRAKMNYYQGDDIPEDRAPPRRNIYLRFFSGNQKVILGAITGIVLIVCFALMTPKENFYNFTKELSLINNKLQATDSMYLQSLNPFIYEEMMKQLRTVQKAAVYLQIKQYSTERRTLALQNQMSALKQPGNLNELQARKMIEEALLVYDADKLGLKDYALETTGANIVSIPNTSPTLSNMQFTVFGYSIYPIYSNPRIIIQPEIFPGKCFSFYGEQGRIRIKLSYKIYISAVTMDHVSRTLLTDSEVKTAPKDFKIIGLENENSVDGTTLGTFTYAIDGPTRQTFLIKHLDVTLSFEFVEVYILSNYGNPDSTCIYRIRIHGQTVF